MFKSIYRTLLLYIIVVVAIRLMGKRQIGEMQPGELVVTLLISDIASMPLQDTDQPILLGVSAIFTLVTVEIFISLLSLKSLRIRKLFSGKSAILIRDGVIDKKELKKVRMTVLDLVEMLRGQNVFDISTVSFAVLETGGNLSVLLKAKDQPATVSDIGKKKDKSALPLPVISDGRLLPDSLKLLGITEKELRARLSRKNLKPPEVFLMTLDSGGKESIVKKGDIS